MSINFDGLDTPQKWTEAAEQVATNARDAAKSGDKDRMRAVADDCSTFIDERTLDCPKELAHIISGVQVELSQLIVADDIVAIKARTPQFEAYLQDIEHLSASAERSADLISFKSVSSAIGDITGIVKDLQNAKKQLAKSDGADNAADSIQDVLARLKKIQDAFANLDPG